MNLIRAVDLRSNGHHAFRLRGRRWRRRRVPAARLRRRHVAGLGQIGCPGLDFERGWHWEHARGMANSILGFGWGLGRRSKAHGGNAVEQRSSELLPTKQSEREREK